MDTYKNKLKKLEKMVRTIKNKIGINQKANNTNNRVNRGGNYNNSGSNNPASDRNNNNPYNSNSNNSSRPALIFFQIICFTECIQRSIRY